MKRAASAFCFIKSRLHFEKGAAACELEKWAADNIWLLKDTGAALLKAGCFKSRLLLKQPALKAARFKAARFFL